MYVLLVFVIGYFVNAAASGNHFRSLSLLNPQYSQEQFTLYAQLPLHHQQQADGLAYLEKAALFSAQSSNPNYWFALAEHHYYLQRYRAAMTFVAIALRLDLSNPNTKKLSQQIRDKLGVTQDFDYWKGNAFMMDARRLETMGAYMECLPHQPFHNLMQLPFFFAAMDISQKEQSKTTTGYNHKRLLSSLCICFKRTDAWLNHVRAENYNREYLVAAFAFCSKYKRDGEHHIADVSSQQFDENNRELLDSLNIEINQVQNSSLIFEMQSCVGMKRPCRLLQIVPPSESMVNGGMEMLESFSLIISGMLREALIYGFYALEKMNKSSDNSEDVKHTRRVLFQWMYFAAVELDDENLFKKLKQQPNFEILDVPSSIFAKRSSSTSYNNNNNNDLQYQSAKKSYRNLPFPSSFLSAMQSYLAIHARVPELLHPKSRVLVIFVPEDVGLGNRLLSLISSVSFAVMTNRTVLYHWLPSSPHYGGLWDRQQKLENLFELFDVGHLSLTQVLMDRPEFAKRIENAPMIHFHENIHDQAGISSFWCSKAREFDENQPILLLSTNQDITGLLSVSPIFQLQFQKMTQSKRFSHFARFLLFPSLPVWKATNELSEILSSRPLTIGIHIRGYHQQDPSYVFTRETNLPSNNINNNSINDNMLNVVADKRFQVLHHCAMQKLTALYTSSEKNKLTVFIVSDREELSQKMKSSIQTNFPSADIFDSKSMVSIYQHLSLAQTAAADIWLLSKCNIIIRGGQMSFSTFSFMANSLGGGNRPWCSFECGDVPMCDYDFHGEPRLGLYQNSFYPPSCSPDMRKYADDLDKNHSFFPYCKDSGVV